MEKMPPQEILKYIKNIKEKITSLTANKVSLVLATKMVDKEVLQDIAMYDKLIFGENRVQEFVAKHFEHPNVSWHFIGQLQSNKVKHIIDKVDLIHSVDRLSLAKEIDRLGKKKNIISNVLIEVNIAKEPTKGGISPHAAIEFISEVQNMQHLSIKGIMAVMPNIKSEELEKYYLQLSSLYDTIKKSFDTEFPYLSAGMSSDYLTAIKYGANMIRVGRAIFGQPQWRDNDTR